MSPRNRYLVIGSNCFTGSHIVDALRGQPGAQVVGVSRAPEYKPLYLPYAARRREGWEFRQIDFVREPERLLSLLDEVRPQVVIHVAALSEVALSHELPLEYFETNTVGTVRLCDHLRRRDYLERYVHISSAEIFGSTLKPVDESARFDPTTPYAVSKAAADMYLHSLMRNFNFPAILIRSTNVYGRHQKLYKIIPRTAIYLKMGKTIELHGGGTAKKSFIHVRDVVAGLMLALEKGAPGTYHFSVPSSRTVADVVRLVCDCLGRDFSGAVQAVGERLGQDSRYELDCGKAARELGWSPRISLEDGVKETIAWIEANWEEVRREPLTYIHSSSRLAPEGALRG